MAVKARFNFDMDFDTPPPAREQRSAAAQPPVPTEPEVPKVDLVTHLIQLGEADATGRAEGFEAGRRSEEALAAQRLADEAARLVQACHSLTAAREADRFVVEKEATKLAVVVARKLAARLVATEPLTEIRSLMADCLGPLRKAPHLVLRLAAEDAEKIRPEVERLARETGFDGRLVILGDPDTQRGDCRIEWADGGIVREAGALAASIDAALDRYFDARAARMGLTFPSAGTAGLNQTGEI